MEIAPGFLGDVAATWIKTNKQLYEQSLFFSFLGFNFFAALILSPFLCGIIASEIALIAIFGAFTSATDIPNDLFEIYSNKKNPLRTTQDFFHLPAFGQLIDQFV
jgi:uncharacterized membrane protein